MILSTTSSADSGVTVRHVMTRTEIMEQVWDMHHDPMTNTVDVLVKHLRDKIDRDFEPKLIQTVRGVGYMIKPEGAEQ